MNWIWLLLTLLYHTYLITFIKRCSFRELKLYQSFKENFSSSLMLSSGDTNSIAIHSIHHIFFFFGNWFLQCVSIHLIFWTHWTISILPIQFFHFLFCFTSLVLWIVHTRCNNAQDTQGSCPGGLHSLPEPSFLCFSSPLVSILGAFQALFWEAMSCIL